MLRQRLGSTGFEISSIGLGAWAMGGWMWGGQQDADSVAAIHSALDHGVNWIDTAPIYGSGQSERVVGDVLKSLPASKRPFVFTKFGEGDDSAIKHRSATRKEVLAECDASLERLGVECIDLYQLHWPVPQPVEETAGACQELLEAGKIRAIGVCNFSSTQIETWVATGVPLHVLQVPYNILRPAVEADQLPWCASHGLGSICYSPLFRGLLWGTWSRSKTFPPDDARGGHKDYLGARFQRNLDAIDAIKTLAAEKGLSCAQLCVGVLLHTPGLTAAIVGARDGRQGSLIAGLGVVVTDEQVRAVHDITARLRRDLEGL